MSSKYRSRLGITTKLLFVLCLLHLAIQATAQTCGRPGKPEHGDRIPLSESYNEGDQVMYTCDNGYYSKREDEFVQVENRTCQCNGTWSGTVPECDYIDLIFNNSPLTRDGPDTNLTLWFDGNDETCGEVQFHKLKNEATRDFLIPWRNFTHSTAYVRFSLRSAVKHKIHGVLLPSYAPCEEVPPPKVTEVLLKCDSVDNTTHATFSFPKTLLDNEKALSVCSWSIFVQPDAICGSPDEPLHGNFTNDGTTSAYSCKSGYYLPGDSAASCTNETGYQWHPRSAPKCLPNGETDPGGGCNTSSVLALLQRLEFQIPIGLVLLLINCVVIYCIYRCYLKRGKRPQADDTEPVYANVGSAGDKIVEIENLTEAEDGNESKNAPGQQLNRISSPDDYDPAYDQIPRPSTKSNTATLTHFSKNGEEYAQVTKSSKAKLKSASGQTSSEMTDTYASIENTKSAETITSVAMSNYLRNGDVYAQVTKRKWNQPKADNGRNNSQDVDDTYASVNDGGYATVQSKRSDNKKKPLPVEHYVENGEEYAQVVKTSKAVNKRTSAAKSVNDSKGFVKNTAEKDPEDEVTYAQVDKSTKKGKKSTQIAFESSDPYISTKSTAGKGASTSGDEVIYTQVDKSAKNPKMSNPKADLSNDPYSLVKSTVSKDSSTSDDEVTYAAIK